MMFMPKVIEVYVKNEEVLTQPTYIGRPLKGHWCTFKETYKSEKVMSETDKAALKIAEEVAKETGIELKVYDISSIKGKMKASLKGVKNTPTIVVGKNKVEGVPEKEQLMSLATT
jgi:predicted DsbA family dithiol-disulfide isomerase